LLILLAIWLWLSPVEAQLGNVIKLVYVHGALVWAGLFTFSLAGLLALVALLSRRAVWYRGTRAAGTAALVAWLLNTLSSMAVTGFAWGQLIAWNEPRVQASGLILLAAIVLAVVIALVDHPDFMAVVHLVMGLVPWIVVRQAEIIRHPADPIGGSGSMAIQGFYLLIVLTVVGLVLALVAWLWTGSELRSRVR
jgi:heme exporter protein C